MMMKKDLINYFIFFKLKFYFFIFFTHECFACMYVSVPPLCTKGGSRIPWGWSYSCELPCGSWELNPGMGRAYSALYC